MAVKILGCAMDREVESMFWRPEVYRARESVVDDRDEFVMLREFYDSFEIRYLHERIRDRLDIDRLRVRPDLFSQDSGSFPSMKVYEMPNFSRSLVTKSWVPPYRQSWARSWSLADITVSRE